MPHDQQRHVQRVPHRVDRLPEDDILNALVAVRAHDQQVRLEPAREADDLRLGVLRVRHRHLHFDPLPAQAGENLVQVFGAKLDLRG